MRLSWGLALSAAAVGAQAGRLAVRQNLASSPLAPSTSTAPAAGSTPPPVSTPPPSPPVPTSRAGDSTILVTRTVTLPNRGSTITSTTTVSISTLVTVTVTTTDIATTTVTRFDNDTSTKVVYVTSTQIVNAKRSLAERDLHYLGDRPAQVEARATPAPAVPAPRLGNRGFHRRALVTDFVTVTADSGGGDSTVIVTATRAIRSTTTSVVHTTMLVTEIDQANAKTTVTTTETIIVKVTQVKTGAVETVTSTPTGAPGGSGNNNNNNPDSNNNNNNNDSGLSTGAKAGIGAGAGVVALIAIGAAAFCFMRRRRHPKPDPDDLLGSPSEVPVGFGGAARPMSQGLSSTPGIIPRREPALPNVQPEGYRGTAMGDGRAGYAKPETYGASHGASHAPTRSATASTQPGTLSPRDALSPHPTSDPNSALVSPVTARPRASELGNDGTGARWHQTEAAEMATDNPAAGKWHTDGAHEIDGQPMTSHQSGPVYEMPTETYR
ncbi:hypothetical protein E4U42_003222 [Claviceps africana]|uniref:Mid2 domain-containing protein n=1 Tax=Claviceps africana TaxID=83212 RepID=A0A8K0JCD9_9HYPO|nr:hypothetical protein E4U42_003222 [Claviceps africana]